MHTARRTSGVRRWLPLPPMSHRTMALVCLALPPLPAPFLSFSVAGGAAPYRAAGAPQALDTQGLRAPPGGWHRVCLLLKERPYGGLSTTRVHGVRPRRTRRARPLYDHTQALAPGWPPDARGAQGCTHPSYRRTRTSVSGFRPWSRRTPRDPHPHFPAGPQARRPPRPSGLLLWRAWVVAGLLLLSPLPGFADFWTGYTSEEYPPVRCHQGGIMSGVACDGRYCDNMALLCSQT